jgi:hypothetical protein
MENQNLSPAGLDAVPAAPRRSGRTRRVATTIAASAVLLGSGAVIGIALTGGASASTGRSASGGTSALAGSSAAGTASSIAAVRCAKIAAKLRASGHPAAATRLHALCAEPLLRLALVGGEYGR